MKIVYEKNEYSTGIVMFACCDKCDNPIKFFIGNTNGDIRNNWDRETHKFCEKCGSFMDWDNLNTSVPNVFVSQELDAIKIEKILTNYFNAEDALLIIDKNGMIKAQILEYEYVEKEDK